MLKILAGAALALSLMTGAAYAENYGMYVEPKVGVGVTQVQNDVTSKGSIDWGAAVGFDWGEQWTLPVRAELEYMHQGHKTFKIKNEGKVGVSRDVLAVNAMYDFRDCPWVTPYLGAGMGIAWTRTSADVHHDTPGLQANLIAGVSKQLAEHWVADLQARYVFCGIANSASGDHHQKGAEFMAGIRYTF